MALLDQGLVIGTNIDCFTGSAIPIASTGNTIDLLSNRDIAEGTTLFMRVRVTSAFATGGVASIQFSPVLHADPTAPQASGTYCVLGASHIFSASQLPANTTLYVACSTVVTPSVITQSGLRYLGCWFLYPAALAGQTFTAGRVDIDFTLSTGRSATLSYPTNYTVGGTSGGNGY